MAMAIPDKATIFASTPPNFIAIKVNKTDTGSINEISKAIRRRRKMSNTMAIVIKICSHKADSRVRIVSSISSERS